MVFSSSLFIFIFLPVFLLLYEVTPQTYKNYLLLIASLFFYAWGAPKFVFVLIGSLLINFYAVQGVYNSSETKKRKLFLALSIFINIGLLLYFKYANFFVENVNYLCSILGYSNISWTKVALPIGISFFTFQSLTYTLDVYNKIHVPLRKVTDYFVYILMFPQLIAGPIVRFNSIADQIIDRKSHNTADLKLMGVYRFAIGLAKKMLIANTLGLVVDDLFLVPDEAVTSTISWLAIIAYSFQIYYDFSGYSDMAIGLGYLIGFKFPENFNNPYVSQSITEFWKRWHITLGAWMRDYLYIPLGGNKVAVSRMYINLAIVFLISGLWHGDSWNFVLWGAWHGLFLILDKVFLNNLMSKLGELFRTIFTYIIVLIGWVPFYFEDGLQRPLLYIYKMFSFDFSLQGIDIKPEFIVTLCVAALFAFFYKLPFGKRIHDSIFIKEYSVQKHSVLFFVSIILLVVSVSYVSSSGFNPFIYYRF